MATLMPQQRPTNLRPDRALRVTRREDLESAWDTLMRYAEAHGLSAEHVEVGEQLVHHLQCHWADELAVLRRRQILAISSH